MLRIEEFWPPYGLVITCGDLHLTPVREEDIPALAAVAADGVPRVPQSFGTDWDRGTPEEIARNLAVYHWRTRARLSPKDWVVEFAVRADGQIAGAIGVSAADYPSTRSATTGSWLGGDFQRRGIGTRMRQAIAATFFDHFGAVELHSGYVRGNTASHRVSEKVGYRPNGSYLDRGTDGMAHREERVVLTAETFNRPDAEIRVTGADAFAAFLELPRDPLTDSSAALPETSL